MNDPHWVLLQKGLLYQVCQPLRGRNDRQIQTGKQLFLSIIEHSAPIEEPAKLFSLCAVVTSVFPAVTMIKREICTIRGKRPAVMEDPNQLRLFLPEVRKEHIQITVVTVNVVQQHHTGR